MGLPAGGGEAKEEKASPGPLTHAHVQSHTHTYTESH